MKPPEPIYPTSTVLFYARQMPKKKATSKRKAKQRDEEETLEAAPAESPAPSARRSTRSTIHLGDDGPSVTPRSKQVELVESDKTDSAHPFAEKINWYAVCADERKGVVIEASAFRCSPPRKQPKPSPVSPSAYMHVLSLSVQATTSLSASPLSLLSRYEYEERGVRHRRRRRRWRRRRRRRRRRRGGSTAGRRRGGGVFF